MHSFREEPEPPSALTRRTIRAMFKCPSLRAIPALAAGSGGAALIIVVPESLECRIAAG